MTSFVFDPTGTAGANLVTGVALPVSTIGQTLPQLNFMPDPLFYSTGFSLSYTDNDGVSFTLNPGDDYSFLLEIDGVAANNSKIFAAITLNRFDLDGTITAAYQAVGGNFMLNKMQIIDAIQGGQVYNPRVAYLTLKPWPDIFQNGSTTPIALNSAAAVNAVFANAVSQPVLLNASVSMLPRSKRFYIEGGLVQDGNGVKL